MCDEAGRLGVSRLPLGDSLTYLKLKLSIDPLPNPYPSPNRATK